MKEQDLIYRIYAEEEEMRITKHYSNRAQSRSN